MSDDLVTPLRNAAYLAFEDGTNDYTTPALAAARITELEAALNHAKRHFLDNNPIKAFVEVCTALAFSRRNSAALKGGKDE